MKLSEIKPDINNIFFYWDGRMSETRMQILKDSVESTAMFNPKRSIWVVTNTSQLYNESFNFENIKCVSWDNSVYDNTFNSEKVKKIYHNISDRDRSDLLRIIFLYVYGGSYIDTDDISIRALPDVKHFNIFCRSYDPHVCHYNKLTPEDCIEGKYRESRGHDNIPLFPRNDCWINFKPRSRIINELLNHEDFKNSDKAVSIYNSKHSWQSLTLDVLKNNIKDIDKEFRFYLTLMYVYESHISRASVWDNCSNGGEMCDIWPGPRDNTWGKYRTSKEEAMQFFKNAKENFPYASHFWLHDKDSEKEWLIDELDETKEYLISTWIYDHIKRLIRC